MARYWTSVHGDVAVDYPDSWAHPCGSTATKTGLPCKRFVPNKFEHCPWHNGKPRRTRLSKKAKLQAEHDAALGRLVQAQAAEAALSPADFATIRGYRVALGWRRKRVREATAEVSRLAGELAKLDEVMAARAGRQGVVAIAKSGG